MPLDVEVTADAGRSVGGDLDLVSAYAIFTVILDFSLLVSMIWLFRRRWRVSQ
jgi:hypothetical protein